VDERMADLDLFIKVLVAGPWGSSSASSAS